MKIIKIDINTALDNNQIQKIQVEDKEILIAHIGDEYFAFSAKCPHAGYSLEKGFLDIHKACISCPLHGYKYNIRNGLSITGDGYRLKTYQIEARENEYFLHFK